MNDAQAEALSRIFAEMATKHDLTQMEGRLQMEMTLLKADLQSLRAELTWKMIAIVGFFVTASTILSLFVGWDARLHCGSSQSNCPR